MLDPTKYLFYFKTSTKTVGYKYFLVQTACAINRKNKNVIFVNIKNYLSFEM